MVQISAAELRLLRLVGHQMAIVEGSGLEKAPQGTELGARITDLVSCFAPRFMLKISFGFHIFIKRLSSSGNCLDEGTTGPDGSEKVHR